MNLSAEEIARATAGKLLCGNPFSRAEGVCTDSRKLRQGELFIPLKGPRFDGHHFMKDAMAKGAAGSLIERGREEIKHFCLPGRFLVETEEVMQALGDLAYFWRRRQPAKVIAITGSNGKTTTKEMTAQILAGTFRVLKTEGNLNNRIGLPLTVLKLSSIHAVAVLEMGMSEPGEIQRLKAIADPQVSIITNIGSAHLEFLGNLEGVARAKGELWQGLRKEDWIVINADDPQVVALAAPAGCQKRKYGITREADIRGENLSLENGKARFHLRMMDGVKHRVELSTYGKHNVYNALAAASLANILGVDVEAVVKRLKDFRPFPGRGVVVHLARKVHVLDDSYNSNPDSVAAMLQAFHESKGDRRGLLVMGDMLELGPVSSQAHKQAGRIAGGLKFEEMFFLGEKAEDMAQGAREAGADVQRVHVAQDQEEVLKNLGKMIKEGDWIMVKGSRRMQLEHIIKGLEERLGRG